MGKWVKMEKAARRKECAGTNGFPHGKSRKKGGFVFGICLVFCAALLFGGCGKHACAICGGEADGRLSIGGKEFHICGNCYHTYVEEQQLFEDDP